MLGIGDTVANRCMPYSHPVGYWKARFVKEQLGAVEVELCILSLVPRVI